MSCIWNIQNTYQNSLKACLEKGLRDVKYCFTENHSANRWTECMVMKLVGMWGYWHDELKDTKLKQKQKTRSSIMWSPQTKRNQRRPWLHRFQVLTNCLSFHLCRGFPFLTVNFPKRACSLMCIWANLSHNTVYTLPFQSKDILSKLASDKRQAM